MSIESDHQDPVFQEKKYLFFKDFILRHLSEARAYKKNGLLVEGGSRKWRNIPKHQILSGVMTETISELLGRPEEETKQSTSRSLTHDVGKRREQEGMSKEEIIAYESHKSGRPLVATSSNFTGFSEWGVEEYLLRYVDSSVGNNPRAEEAGHWYGVSKTEKLPEVVILPWRQRIQMFKENKVEEGEKGILLYGMTTWEKLEEIMRQIEEYLFREIIEKNPNLGKRYTDHSQLTELIEERIHEKILDYQHP